VPIGQDVAFAKARLAVALGVAVADIVSPALPPTTLHTAPEWEPRAVARARSYPAPPTTSRAHECFLPQTLLLDGAPLLDPLSLRDYPAVVAACEKKEPVAVEARTSSGA
jgi:hypothetical protein